MRARLTCGCASMSTSQLHTMPSVLLVIRLCAFCVPTICMAYTGCVCPAADSGVLSTGRCFDRVSHRRICPEYVPPNIKFEWNGENVTERTSDWMQLHEFSNYRGRKRRHAPVNGTQTLVARASGGSTPQQCRRARLVLPGSCCTMHSRALGTDGHVKKPVTRRGDIGQAFGDQLISVMDLFFPYRSS